MTKNFKQHEFACRCGCGFNDISEELVEGLQELRDAIKLPIRIISGCRCAAHNKRVGGAPKSQHIQGLAVDMAVFTRNGSPMPVRELYQHVKRIKAFRGVGVSDEGGFIHVDVRKKAAKWCYRKGVQSPWTELAV